MVKSYLRYYEERSLGSVASPYCPIAYSTVSSITTSDLVFSAALDTVAVWSLRQGKMIHNLFYKNFEQQQVQAFEAYDKPNINITQLAVSQDGKRVAVGYQDGRVCIFSQQQQQDKWALDLNSTSHTTAITSLVFSDDSALLASGSDDTDIVVWDVTSFSGLYRLKGHKGRITGLVFLAQNKILLSGSKDMLLKVWELDTQHCVQTLIGTRNEIWSMAKNPQETRLVVGSIDQELRMWSIEALVDATSEKPLYERDLVFLGHVKRKEDTGRVWQVKFDKTGRLLAVHGDSKGIEVFRQRTLKEQKVKYHSTLQKLKKKKRDEQKEKDAHIPDVDDDEETEDALEQVDGEKIEVNYADVEFQYLKRIEASQKVRSFDFHPIDVVTTDNLDANSFFKVVVGTLRNSIEEYIAPFNTEDTFTRTGSISRQAHGMPIRGMSLASDFTLACTVANKECKIWNIESGSNVRSMNANGYGLCCRFLPGNKHVVVGTKQGNLELYDLNSGELLEQTKAHDGAIWSVIVKPDKRGLITASADQHVKFWDFTLLKDKQTQEQRIGLTLEHILKMNDDVLSVQCSSNAKYLVVSLLDTTVKVFYLDSLKFFLSLYGHKLPVNCFDIAHDESIIVTAGQDKNVKIWGLDYGDCHKSIFAHDESITGIQFVDQTHYFFTCAKDGSVKHWDADNGECIQIIRPPCLHSPLSCLVVSQEPTIPGFRALVAGHERNILVYKQSEEQVFMEEEKEKRTEQEYEKELVKSQQFKDLAQPNAESTQTGVRTIETIRDGEKMIEALQAAAMEEDRQRQLLAEKVKISPNPLMLGLTVDDYIWTHLKKIRGSEVENVMAILPYAQAIYLLRKLNMLIDRKDIPIELASKIIFILIRLHRSAIMMDQTLFPLIQSISTNVKSKLAAEKNMLGYNMAAMRFVKRRLNNEKELITLDTELTNQKMQLSKVSKKRYVSENAMKQLSTEKEDAKWKTKMNQKMANEKAQQAKKLQDMLL